MRGLRVTILGAGTAVPTVGAFPAGVLVQSARTTVLVDAGPCALRRLPDVGVGLEDIDAVLLTHRHLDHTSRYLHPARQTPGRCDDEGQALGLDPAVGTDFLGELRRRQTIGFEYQTGSRSAV